MTTWRRLFEDIHTIEAPSALHSAILERIAREKIRLARIRLAFFGTGIVASLAALIPTYRFLTTDLSQSGFGDYISLFFSEGFSILSYGKTFLISLAESAPLMGTTLALVVLFVLIGSARFAMKNMRAAFGSSVSHLPA